jgi:hypothetical protein
VKDHDWYFGAALITLLFLLCLAGCQLPGGTDSLTDACHCAVTGDTLRKGVICRSE